MKNRSNYTLAPANRQPHSHSEETLRFRLAALGMAAFLTLLFTQDASASLLAVNLDFGSTHLLSVDQATGAVKVIGSNNLAGVLGIAVAPDGQLYAYAPGGGGINTIDPATGAATLVTHVSGLGPIGPGDIAFSPSGKFYGVGSIVGQQFDLFSVDLTTGVGTDIGPIVGPSTFHALVAMAFDASGTLWVYDGVPKLYRVDPATGAILASVDVNLNPIGTAGMSFDPVSGALYLEELGGEDNLYTLNTTTGVATKVGSDSAAWSISGLAFIQDTPEPATFTLLLGGLCTLTALRRSHKND